MAKDSKGKFQFVFLNLEGDEETIQEAVRQAGVILNRGMSPSHPPRTLIAVPVQTPKALENGGQNGASTHTEQVYEIVDDESSDNGDASAKTSATVAAKPKREKKAPRTPALLKGFDPNAADVSLENFVNQKDTSTQFNKYRTYAKVT